MSIGLILLAGLGISLLMEGLLFLIAPGVIRDILKSLSAMPERELVLSGAFSAAVGAAILAWIVFTV